MKFQENMDSYTVRRDTGDIELQTVSTLYHKMMTFDVTKRRAFQKKKKKWVKTNKCWLLVFLHFPKMFLILLRTNRWVSATLS